MSYSEIDRFGTEKKLTNIRCKLPEIKFVSASNYWDCLCIFTQFNEHLPSYFTLYQHTEVLHRVSVGSH